MADLPPSLLVSRGQKMHVALLLSVLVHALGAGGALLAARAGAADRRIAIDQKPIVAKLVRLGEERDPRLLPRKEASPPPPPPQQAAPPPPPPSAPPPAPEPAPQAKAVVPTTKAPAEPEPQARPPEPRPATPERGPPADLDAAIRRVLGDVDPDARPDDGPRYGSPDGDPFGDAAEASEGDRYLALVTRALRENYRVPSIINERERVFLNATVVMFVGPDGRILRREIERPSGNPHFDGALLRAVDSSSPLPPPPRGWAQRFEREGLGVNFRL